MPLSRPGHSSRPVVGWAGCRAGSRWSAVATEDDEGWLDAALSVFSTASDGMRFEFRDAFVGMGESYELSARERKRIRRLIASVPDRPELGDLNLRPEVLADTLVDLVRTVVAFEAALEEVTGA